MAAVQALQGLENEPLVFLRYTLSVMRAPGPQFGSDEAGNLRAHDHGSGRGCGAEMGGVETAEPPPASRLLGDFPGSRSCCPPAPNRGGPCGSTTRSRGAATRLVELR